MRLPKVRFNGQLGAVLPGDEALESLALVSAQLHLLAPEGLVLAVVSAGAQGPPQERWLASGGEVSHPDTSRFASSAVLPGAGAVPGCWRQPKRARTF
jgi:hypothetical protein